VHHFKIGQNKTVQIITLCYIPKKWNSEPSDFHFCVTQVYTYQTHLPLIKVMQQEDFSLVPLLSISSNTN